MPGNWELYLKKVERLKKNREKVPEKELRTKYKKSYENLLQEIKLDTEYFLLQYCIGWLPFFKEENQLKTDFMIKVQSVFDWAKTEGVMKRISRAVFVEYDPEKILDIADEEILPKIKEAYEPYWARHCLIQPDGKIWNDLICMEWDHASNVWKRIDSGGWQAWTLMFPPLHCEQQQKAS